MENASKALLIAGAVLIVILIIGVGMAIYNGATGTINQSIGQMDAQQIQMFNQQFEQYAGDRVQGTKVKTLISSIKANAKTNPDMQVKLIAGTGVSVNTEGNDITAGLKTTSQYKVTTSDTDGNGLIDQIKIEKLS